MHWLQHLPSNADHLLTEVCPRKTLLLASPTERASQHKTHPQVAGKVHLLIRVLIG